MYSDMFSTVLFLRAYIPLHVRTALRNLKRANRCCSHTAMHPAPLFVRARVPACLHACECVKWRQVTSMMKRGQDRREDRERRGMHQQYGPIVHKYSSVMSGGCWSNQSIDCNESLFYIFNFTITCCTLWHSFNHLNPIWLSGVPHGSTSIFSLLYYCGESFLLKVAALSAIVSSKSLSHKKDASWGSCV